MKSSLTILQNRNQLALSMVGKPETPLDILFPYPETTDGDEFIQEGETRAEETRQITRFHILKSQNNNKMTYESRHRGKNLPFGRLSLDLHTCTTYKENSSLKDETIPRAIWTGGLRRHWLRSDQSSCEATALNKGEERIWFYGLLTKSKLRHVVNLEHLAEVLRSQVLVADHLDRYVTTAVAAADD
ncbi:hypothetical protein LAZ67_2002174 [Cordylochernes scorpioides]|uniref:Uncharacterized protein n=1 Tax=Cordylochernes scorpioides TaxID=51811 RepID=A0ABY6K1V4_9ARAC|nr:hypothetical protein LAZ67_2002174 [Cordylochernes scorpioides]